MRRPQRNRCAARLRSDVVEIAHAGGVEVLARDTLAARTRAEPAAILALRPLEGLRSVVSGDPALTYRSGDLEIALTPDECLGLVVGELDAAEACVLAETYGDALEWNAATYDAATLEPRLPRVVRSVGPEPTDCAIAAAETGVEPVEPVETAACVASREPEAGTARVAGWFVACRVGTEASGLRDFLLTGETHPSGWDLWSENAERGKRHADVAEAETAMAAVVIADLRERCRVSDGTDLRMTRRG